ncbi:PREDICTED: E3 ubiquitin-protein ligase HOS1 [Tarenaya hassleriana]|uniref:E3 ubiquitin-protein ligase HOS1 n=1 Tax=Tarenaya hassleriana TaxID=28532 RepID=UPI00053C78E1|nr:PREDICTED: E3 ubiquitin-protein ligase HOS1 [Tarenaya hassleriana]
MDWREINGASSAARSASLLPQPNYSSKAVQEALKHLASINLRELCNEAKVERCRATRDLASCGRFVHYVLNSCGHASLCTECCQRCDVCPICRSPIAKSGNRLRLRLYYECVEAGLISKTSEEMSQDSDEEEYQLRADVHRLYSFFDVAMDNSLISVVCHYITDVCMDETAVSSDPVIAFLLDEVVVKDWVKRTFRNILVELRGIYNLELEEMQARLDKLLKFLKQLSGLFSVLEVLESAFKGSVSAQLEDLEQLRDLILNTKQHLDVMVWCIRHKFLNNVKSRYSNFTTWHSLVRERKSAAIRRAWPDVVDQNSVLNGQGGSLFIEDALENLEREPEYSQEVETDLDVGCLQKDDRLFLRSKIEGKSGCFPFENLRTATDLLFLHGSSDLVVAKQAIFLYYLFDRHWTTPEENWKHVIDDFAATFGITRHSLLESFVFYLLDDHTDEALQEACRILPEICGPETYPKVARVLLERQNPETALMVLRWSGRDGGSELVSVGEAVTAVRVRVECGLLSEAFMYQRTLCLKVKENKLKWIKDMSDDTDSWSWTEWMEVLVTEFCCLCIRRNLVDRIIELPWNSAEEKCLYRCLLDSATDDPSSTAGSLLVIFYLQRYRYIKAYQVDLTLQKMEEAFISENSVSEEVISRMRSQSHWRTELVDKAIDLLPVIQQQQVRSGQFPETEVASDVAAEAMRNSVGPNTQQADITDSFAPSATDSVLFQRVNDTETAEQSVYESPFQSGQIIKNPSLDLRQSPSIFHERLFSSSGKGQKSEATSISKMSNSTLFKDLNRSASKPRGKSYQWADETSQEVNADRFPTNGSSPYLRQATSNPVMTTPSSSRFSRSAQNLNSDVSGKGMQVDNDYSIAMDDPMDMSSSYKDNVLATGNGNSNGGIRWRSDGTSDEDDEPSRSIGSAKAMATSSVTGRGRPRRRFTRR